MAGDHTELDLGGLAPDDPPALVYDEGDGGFEVVRRGYDQRQVDSHLGRLDAEIRILVADRKAAVEQAAQLGRELDESRARADRLRSQVRTLISSPTSIPGMSERMRSMLRLAEDEVIDMLAQAETEAARRRHEAEQEAAEIRSAALADAERSAAEDAKRRAECEAECAAAVDAMAEERRTAAAAVEAEREASLSRIAKAEEDARLRLAEERSAWEMRKALIEEDFALAMDRRRADAIAELEAGRTEALRRNAAMIASAQEQSRRTVDMADEYARCTIADAQRRVAELGVARERVVAQLVEARAIMHQALGTLSATPERELVERAAHAEGEAGDLAEPAAEVTEIATEPATQPDPGPGGDSGAAPATATDATATTWTAAGDSGTDSDTASGAAPEGTPATSARAAAASRAARPRPRARWRAARRV